MGSVSPGIGTFPVSEIRNLDKPQDWWENGFLVEGQSQLTSHPNSLKNEEVGVHILYVIINPYWKDGLNNTRETYLKEYSTDLIKVPWASLVAQWLRICLPMQGTRVRALVWEDPTCRGATRPVSHNY